MSVQQIAIQEYFPGRLPIKRVCVCVRERERERIRLLCEKQPSGAVKDEGNLNVAHCLRKLLEIMA